MRLVIEIPDDVYKSCRNLKNSPYYDNSFRDTAIFAIGNGTVLPEQHGRLVDVNLLCEDLINRWDIADISKEEMIKAVMAEIVTPIIVSQPTILEGTVKE